MQTIKNRAPITSLTNHSVKVIRKTQRTKDALKQSALSLAASIALVLAVSPEALAGLRDYPAALQTPIGAVARGSNIKNNVDAGAHNSTLNEEFNLVGCENDLKMYIWTGWDSVNDLPIINFEAADAVANFARTHGQRMRGHCLVYHCAVPWFLNKSGDNITTTYTDDQIKHMVRIYIKTVMQRYDDIIDQWDVTNEVLNGSGNLSSTWRNGSATVPDFWYLHLGGADSITNIYTWARQADQNCKLYYCDYGTEMPGSKFNGMMNFINHYRSLGCPIDGVAFQCHENTGSPNNILSRANTATVNNAGLEWQVSELDVQIPNSSPTQSDWDKQNAIYSTVSDICTQDPNCKGMMLWGFTNKYSWLSPATGLIFNSSYGRNTGYYAINYRYINSVRNYGIISKNGTNKGLDVVGSSLADGADVQQYGFWGGGANQFWSIEMVSGYDGYFRIVNENSGKCLDVSGASTADGANIQQWGAWSPGLNQLWAFKPVGHGYFAIVNKNSGKCLDVSGASTANGANIVQYGYRGGANQMWRLQP